MRVLAITNLYPRPDQPAMGLFNYQMLAAMARRTAVRVVCLVPEWRVWRWPGIMRWQAPVPLPAVYLPVWYLPLVGRSLGRWFYRVAMDRHVRAADADVVSAAWLYPDAAAAAAWGRRAGKPVWIRVMGSDTFHLNSAVRRRQIARACASAEGFICVAHRQEEALRAAGFAPRKLHYVPNGVDSQRFNHRLREEAARALGLPARRRVLFAGNLVPVKAPDRALAAFERLARRRDDVDLIIIGDGPLRQRLQQLTGRAGLAARVFFAGRRPHDEMPLWMAACDCLCLSSWNEGMPNVVVEALACGLPVAATRVGGCGDLLEGETQAMLVPAGDVEKMADALDELLARPVDRAALAARHGRRSWTNQADEILDLMRGSQ